MYTFSAQKALNFTSKFWPLPLTMRSLRGGRTGCCSGSGGGRCRCSGSGSSCLKKSEDGGGGD